MSTETMTAERAPAREGEDEMPLLGIDHIELFVGNATQAAYWFKHALGFRETAYAGLETGVRDTPGVIRTQTQVVLSTLFDRPMFDRERG